MLHDEQRTPPLEDLETFILVVELGSFTGAAQRLRVPTSTVSRRIARLEEVLAAQLLVRTSRKISLTEVGGAYLERVGPALERIEAATRSVRDESDRVHGHLRVTAPFDVAFGWLSHVCTLFRQRYAEVSVEVIVADRLIDLVGEGIDLAVRAAERLDDSSLVARRLAATTLGLYAAPAYLESRPRPCSIEDLSAHDFGVHARSLGSAGPQRARISLMGPEGERTLEVRAAFISNDFAFLHRIALQGSAIAVLPSTLPLGDSTRLERVLPEYGAGKGNLYVVTPSARSQPRKVTVFRDFLIEHAELIGLCSVAK